MLQRSPLLRLRPIVAVALLLGCGLGTVHAQDVRFGASGSPSGVASLDATWLFLDAPSDEGALRFGVRGDVSARFDALGTPSVAGTMILDAAPEDGVATHLGAGVAVVRAAAPARDLALSPFLLAGAEWPVADFLRLRIEGSLAPRANAAGIGVGLAILPFGGAR